MHTIGENDFKEANRLNDFDYLEKGLEGETGMSTSNMVVYYDQDYESQDDNHNQRNNPNLTTMILNNANPIYEEIDEEEQFDFEDFNDEHESKPLFQKYKQNTEPPQGRNSYPYLRKPTNMSQNHQKIARNIQIEMNNYRPFDS